MPHDAMTILWFITLPPQQDFGELSRAVRDSNDLTLQNPQEPLLSVYPK